MNNGIVGRARQMWKSDREMRMVTDAHMLACEITQVSSGLASKEGKNAHLTTEVTRVLQVSIYKYVEQNSRRQEG